MTRVQRVLAGVSAVGLITLVAGTFLPWFHSGSVERHSYEAASLAGRLSLVDSAFAGAALRVWFAVPLLGAACIGLLALGLLRTGATVTALLAISVGTVALLGCVQSGTTDGLVGITLTGPITTMAGAIVALAGALGALVSRRAHLTRGTGEQP
ncbi:MAG TPA: hypothetical protein VJ870_16860 [Amycolatopsis sp.]|nr:hypothetical protein [Amycolatopsis sp.]